MRKAFETASSKVVPEVKKVFDKNYAADSIDTLATSFNISRNALQDAFKHELGVGIRKYKLNQRMEDAKQMLESRQAIKEVAFTLKYGTISSFSRAFKKYYRVTPTEWQKKAGQNVC